MVVREAARQALSDLEPTSRERVDRLSGPLANGDKEE